MFFLNFFLLLFVVGLPQDCQTALDLSILEEDEDGEDEDEEFEGEADNNPEDNASQIIPPSSTRSQIGNTGTKSDVRV